MSQPGSGVAVPARDDRELVGETPSEFQRRWAAAGTPHIPGCFVFMWGLAERRGSATEEKPRPGGES